MSTSTSTSTSRRTSTSSNARITAIDVITRAEDLAALESEWDALHPPTPFQSSAWLLPWWRAFAAGELCTIVCREGRDLVALAPLFVVRRRAEGPREVQLVGTGNTDYLDILARDEHAQTCAELILEVLADRAQDREGGGWDVCDFRNLRPGSPLRSAAVPEGVMARHLDEAPCPTLDLREPLPSAIAHDIAYGRRRAERDGGLRVQHSRDISVDADAAMDALFALHAMRWRARGEQGMLHDAATRAFHRDVARASRRPGRSASTLQLLTLSLGDTPIAAHYGFVHDRRAYYYLGGFDPRFAKVNAGTLAIAAAIDDARARGATTFDFLGGGEAYKYAWGATDEPRTRRILHRALHASSGR